MAQVLEWLDDSDDEPDFPPVDQALLDPPGLLAVGGKLTPRWLLTAYRHGIFPWFSPGEPLLWWSPDPRMVLKPSEIRITRSLKKRIRNGGFEVTLDHDFHRIIRACAVGHEGGTWITEEMIAAYFELHRLGYGHSVEVWYEGSLVGGLYGVAVGKLFFGESMFSRMNDASKVALALLSTMLEKAGFQMIDCQMHTPHLESLGAKEIPRTQFIDELNKGLVDIHSPSPSDTQAVDPSPLVAINENVTNLIECMASGQPGSWHSKLQ